MLVTKTLLTSLNVNKKNIRKMSSDFVLLFYIANFEQGNIFVVNFEDDFLSWKALLYIFFSSASLKSHKIIYIPQGSM